MSQVPTSPIPGVLTDLSNCDTEPIRIPSLIQPHGVLIAARRSDMRIVYASENSLELLGVPTSLLFEQTLPEALGTHVVDCILQDFGEGQYSPPNIQTFTFPTREGMPFDVVTHRIGDFLCVEIEAASGKRSWKSLSSYIEKSIRDLRRPKTLEDLCALIPILIRAVTGYDRVMMYRFDRDGHGEVIAEEKIAAMEPFLGLHYPATDIPSQARELYVLQRIRAIVDVGYTPVRVLANSEIAQGLPLDMTYCGLRSVSPIHIEYLQNMLVGSTFGISLIHEDQLWGMVICHHRARRLMPPETRALCDILGQLISLLVSLNLQTLEVTERQEKKTMLGLLSAALDGGTSIGPTLAEARYLLPLVGANGAFIRIGGEVQLIGRTPSLADAASLMDTFLSHLVESTLSSEEVGKLFPQFAHLAPVASGALLIALKETGDGILWFRGEVAETVRWAGKPDASKGMTQDGFRLSPRKSFASWEEVQRGRSLPWRASEIRAALGLERIAAKVLLRNAEALLDQLSYTDILTRLPNRRALVDRLAAWQSRGVQAPASILFLDLDNFRDLNEALGHAAGDELLKQISDRLSASQDGKHLVARLGGDEFALFCEDTDLTKAEILANSILVSLSEPCFVEGRSIRTTTSIGIAPMPFHLGGTAVSRTSDPLRVADSAMYVAKHKGGNQVSIVESREHAEMLRLRIAEELVERQRAAKELATAYAQMNEVMDSTSEGILQINHDWVVLYGNRKAVESRVDFEIGKDFWSYFPAISSPLVEQQLRTAMQERSETEYETYYAQRDQWYKVHAFPTRGGISLFFTDITADKNMQDQLSLEQLLREKRIEALSHMAGGLAHEISTPLAIIHGRASDLLSMAGGEALLAEDVQKACVSIVQTADRAMRILRGLRGFAREGRKDPMEWASVEDIVDECMELQDARFARHGIEVRLKIEPDLPPLLCRQVQVGQIVTNLLNNAFDAIVQSNSVDRWVELSVKLCDGSTCIEVTDSGPGIEDHFKAHLMEPFFTTKELGLGMGVGLSLSRAIAQDHGGTLILRKGTPNTCFRLVLPGDAALNLEEEETAGENSL